MLLLRWPSASSPSQAEGFQFCGLRVVLICIYASFDFWELRLCIPETLLLAIGPRLVEAVCPCLDLYSDDFCARQYPIYRGHRHQYEGHRSGQCFPTCGVVTGVLRHSNVICTLIDSRC